MGIRAARGNNAPRLSPTRPAVNHAFNDLAVYSFFIASLSTVYCLRLRSALEYLQSCATSAARRMTMKTTRTHLHQGQVTALLALAFVFAGWQCPARAQELTPDIASKTQQTPVGRTVWHHVGRVFVNPATGKFVYVGYLVHIDPIDGSLFNGSPSESAAHFTFSTDLA